MATKISSTLLCVGAPFAHSQHVHEGATSLIHVVLVYAIHIDATLSTFKLSNDHHFEIMNARQI